MIKFKTKRADGETVKVKAKYNGNLNELQVDMVAIIAEFGTQLARKGIKKERVEAALDNILNVAKDHIIYKEE